MRNVSNSMLMVAMIAVVAGGLLKYLRLCNRVAEPRRTRNVNDNPKNDSSDDSDRPEQLEYG